MKTLKIGQLNCLNRDQESRVELIATRVAMKQLDLFTVQEVTHVSELREAMAKIGLEHSVFRTSPKRDGGFDAQGIFSKTPLVDYAGAPMQNGVIYASTLVGERMVNVFSAHFAWGPYAEYTRLIQADFIERTAIRLEAQHKSSLSILGGDLNAEPNSRTIRYLSGLDFGPDGRSSTRWTDAWEAAGEPTNEFTSQHSTNTFGRNTAFASNVLFPGMLPDRRIDYLFTRGWNYGKIGSPVTFGYIAHPADVELSDHNGIYSEIATEVNGA